jgi:hypothetical protein
MVGGTSPFLGNDANGYIDIDGFVKVGVTSVRVLAQQQAERPFSGAVGFRHGFEKGLGVLDRTRSAGAINLPPPRFGRRRAVFYDNGKVGVINHGALYYHENTAM